MNFCFSEASVTSLESEVQLFLQAEETLAVEVILTGSDLPLPLRKHILSINITRDNEGYSERKVSGLGITVSYKDLTTR